MGNVVVLGRGDFNRDHLMDVEGKLVGAVLELPDKLEIIESSGLVRDDFTNARAAQAWNIIKRMAERRLQVTAETVCSAGRRAQLLTDADLGWLTDLQESNMLNREQALQIAEDIRVASRSRGLRRELQAQCDLLDRGRFSPAYLSGALESMLHTLAVEFTGDEQADTDLLELNEQWRDNIAKGQTMLRPTGIKVLDQILGGGVPRNLYIIQGKPGAGKNALLATSIKARLLADPTCRIGLFGLESGTAWLSRRWQAEDLGIRLSEVGSKNLTPEQWERKAVLDNAHAELLRRVEVYRHNGAPSTELVRRSKRWIFKCGVTDILIDNLREVKPDPRSRQEYHLQIADTITSFRDLYRYGVSTGLLVHDTEDSVSQRVGDERAPHPDKMQGGKDPGAKARLVIGLWRKRKAYRATITKNEMGEASWPNGPTCEFAFNYESATINPDAGRVLDLESEKQKEKREEKDRSLEQSVEDTLRRDALKKKRIAAEAPAEKKPEEPPAQPTLLEVPPSTKPGAT